MPSEVASLLAALLVIPPSKLELLADWFDMEQEKRPDWKDGRSVQKDLRKMAKLSRVAIAEVTGGYSP